jgi:hypothetical protein
MTGPEGAVDIHKVTIAVCGRRLIESLLLGTANARTRAVAASQFLVVDDHSAVESGR